jgi:ribonuclease Z
LTIQVVVTGTGTPGPVPGRAGSGVLFRHDETAIQIDAGRATALRLAEAGLPPRELSALCLTHHHSDHLVGLADVVLSRWAYREPQQISLPIIAPEGASARFARRILDIWDDDIAVRQLHMGIQTKPAYDVQAFEAEKQAALVWEKDGVKVFSGLVHHEPVEPSVSYRIEADGLAVVVSGDTVVCEEMEALAQGADVLVHEAMRKSIAARSPVLDYHSDTLELGALAQRAGVKRLVLYHLFPTPRTPEEEQAFAGDVRKAGFTGELVVARDLTAISL